ncbi:hypothetical protein B7463_g12205, partial [Scytalidium lignicola]
MEISLYCTDLLANVQAAQTTTTVPTPTIPRIAPPNNFDGIITTLAPTPTTAYGPAYIIPALGAALAPILALLTPTLNLSVLTVKP